MQIEVWADIVCPWCYLGKRRFDTALARYERRDEVDVVYRSFELDPTAPADRSEPVLAHLSTRYGIDPAQAQQMQDTVSSLAAAEGLKYRLDLARTARTFDAHRLTHLAKAHGVQDAMAERLFAAYFTEGAVITEVDTLVGLAEQVGLEASAAREVLRTGAYADDVRADEKLASQLGITGVPFFVRDRRVGVSGAQPTDVFDQLLAADSVTSAH